MSSNAPGLQCKAAPEDGGVSFGDRIRAVRYFLYGYYGYGNFGDDLLLRGLIEGIRSRDGTARFWVHNLNEVPGYAFDAGVQFTGLARYMQNVRDRPWQLASYLAKLTRWLFRSDVLVIGGGTLFIDKGRFNYSLALLYVAVLLARLMRKRVVVVGVGVDRLTHPMSRWLTHRILGGADFVAVREAFALPYVAHRPPDRTRLSADLALALQIVRFPVRPRQRQTVGICFIDYYHTVEPSEARHAAYEAAIIRFIEQNRKDRDFFCITFQRKIGQRDDWLVPVLQAKYPNVPILHIDSLEAACEMALAIDILVTTRFHLGILGAIWGKPVVVIDHELKMNSLAADFAFPAISLAEFMSGMVIDLDALLRGYDPQRTVTSLATQRERVAQNFAWMSVHTTSKRM